jgi:hypothetical protein
LQLLAPVSSIPEEMHQQSITLAREQERRVIGVDSKIVIVNPL